MQTTFVIEVNDLKYTIQPNKKEDKMEYEVFTNCEKLFTIKKEIDGDWNTVESDIIPITEDIIFDIGEAIDRENTL